MTATFFMAMRHRRSGQHSGTSQSTTSVVLRLVLVWLLLTTVQAGADDQRLPGKFVWAELVSFDTALSEAFYGPLFDWRFEDQNGYRVAWRGDEAVGGLVYRSRQGSAGKSRWVAYLSVENMDAVKSSLLSAGARIIADSRQINGLGELVVFIDDEGVPFGIIDSAGPDPGDYLADIGSWIWIQLFSRNADQASQFYQRVGGYQRFDNPQTPGAYLLVRDGYARAALSTISPRYPSANPTWVPFVRVADITSTLEKSNALGGKTLVAPSPELHDNRVAIIEAPDGSAVGILVWAPELKATP